MFSGIIEERAEIVRFEKNNEPHRLVIQSSLNHFDSNNKSKVGDSIAIDGVCLTVVECLDNLLSFDVACETLRKSTLSSYCAGDKVNLERSLKLGSRLHGHFVFGHVDSTIKLLSKKKDGDCDKLIWELPANLKCYIAPKCSVAISGISLTVGEVSDNSFSVYIIPHTSKITTLSSLCVGECANLEIDMLARYVNAFLKGGGTSEENSSKITDKFLREHGYLSQEKA